MYALSKLKDFDREELIIFRGGTSLTKCYTDLKRFSEDIDLAVNKDNMLSETQIKKLITDVEKCICVDFEEVENSRFKDQYPYEEKWSNAPIFKLVGETFLKESYKERFGKEFVYGELPNYDDIILSIGKIRSHLISVGE